MQLKLIFFFIFFPVILFGQKLNCCKTVEEVKQTLEGEWIRKDINSEIIYHFWFEGEQGGLEEMEKTDVEGEYLIVSCQPFVDIERNGRKFKMILVHMLETETFNIIKLNSEKFQIKNKEQEIVYTRISN